MTRTTTSITSPLPRRIAAGALLTALTLGGLACGDDTEDASGGAPAVDPPATAAVVSPAACDAWVALHAALAAAPEDPAEAEAFGTELQGIVDDLAAEVPDGAAEHAAALQAGADAVAADGDPGALFAPDAQAAMAGIGALAHEGCEAEALDVVGADYSFDGLAEELPAGRASIAFENTGTEEHELIVLRRNDGSSATLDELLDAGPDGVFAEAAFTGVVFAPPGETAYTALDLEPGTYFALCTIPTGGEEEGEPHFAHGMHQTFEVS